MSWCSSWAASTTNETVLTRATDFPSHPRYQRPQLRLHGWLGTPALDVIRDVNGVFSWYHPVTPLQTAIERTTDLNPWLASKVLSDTTTRGRVHGGGVRQPVDRPWSVPQGFSAVQGTSGSGDPTRATTEVSKV